MKDRLVRINEEIARAVADCVRGELSDPALRGVVSVLRAKTASDLKECKVWVSVLGDETSQKKAMAALTKAAGFVRSYVASTVNLRSTPQMTFVLDDSIEHGMKMRKLIEDVNRADDARLAPPDGESAITEQ